MPRVFKKYYLPRILKANLARTEGESPTRVVGAAVEVFILNEFKVDSLLIDQIPAAERLSVVGYGEINDARAIYPDADALTYSKVDDLARSGGVQEISFSLVPKAGSERSLVWRDRYVTSLFVSQLIPLPEFAFSIRRFEFVDKLSANSDAKYVVEINSITQKKKKRTTSHF